MAQRGRPTVLTVEILDRICSLVRVGNYIETAANVAGVSKDTLYRWLKRGARMNRKVEKDPSVEVSQQDRMLMDFSDSLLEAVATAEAQDAAIIGRAAAGSAAVTDPNTGAVLQPAQPGDWRAAAWRLERRNRRHWGRSSILGDETVDAAEELVPPADRKKTEGGLPVGFVLPISLPPAAHEQLIEALKAQGSLPGEAPDLEGER